MPPGTVVRAGLSARRAKNKRVVLKGGAFTQQETNDYLKYFRFTGRTTQYYETG